MDLLTFSWKRCVDDYEVRKDKHGASFIWPRSSKFETIKPLEIDRLLFRRFAALEPTEAAFVGFANAYGLLTHRSDEEPISTLVRERENLAFATDYWIKGLKGDLERLVNSLPFSALHLKIRDGIPVLEPEHLRDAMWTQLAMSVRQDEKHRTCGRCGTFFAYGPGTKRRETAEYCSPKCQAADAYQRRKSETAPKPAAGRRRKSKARR